MVLIFRKEMPEPKSFAYFLIFYSLNFS